MASTAERAFLSQLRGQLGLGGQAAVDATETQTHAVSAAYAGALAADGAQPVSVPAAAAPAVDQAALDKMVLNYAILNGALELLPQSWASMAIIPLQIKMVYRIGAAHGVALDQGHIREFIATAGVGLTSQYIEQFGRKLLGGLIGKAAGRMLGGLAGLARGRADGGARLVGLLLAATVPALVVGFAVEHFAGTALRHVEVVKRDWADDTSLRSPCWKTISIVLSSCLSQVDTMSINDG